MGTGVDGINEDNIRGLLGLNGNFADEKKNIADYDCIQILFFFDWTTYLHNQCLENIIAEILFIYLF